MNSLAMLDANPTLSLDYAFIGRGGFAGRIDLQNLNLSGDLAGYVYTVPCASQDECPRAAIWHVAGGSTVLGTLGGEQSAGYDINNTGEVVGISTTRRGPNTAYFWSESTGMLKLPFKGHWAGAHAVSDVRLDGTKLVVGDSSVEKAIAWVVRNP